MNQSFTEDDENENILLHPSLNISEEDIDNIHSSASDDNDNINYDVFVDNLKHFTCASQSRFAPQKNASQKSSTCSNETTDSSKLSTSHKSSYDIPFNNNNAYYNELIGNNTSSLPFQLNKKQSFQATNNPQMYYNMLNTYHIPQQQLPPQYNNNSNIFPNMCLFNYNRMQMNYINSSFTQHNNNNYCYNNYQPFTYNNIVYDNTNCNPFYPRNFNMNNNCGNAKTNANATTSNSVTNSNGNSNVITTSKTTSSTSNENFSTLEELLKHLEGGKQIGNYIKCRKNTDIMVNLIKRLPNEKISTLIEMIKPKLKDIMISNNKVSQKLFEQCTSEQRMKVINIIKDNFVDIACNKWGSFSLQALIKNISLHEEQELIKSCICGKINELVINKRATFIVQKLFVILNEKLITSLFDEINSLFTTLITSSLGFGLLKAYLINNKNISIQSKLIENICLNLETILKHPYGCNFICQLIEKLDIDTSNEIINEIFTKMEMFYDIKHFNNLTEKCLMYVSSKILKQFPTSLFTNNNFIQIIIDSDDQKTMLQLLLSKVSINSKHEIIKHLKELNTNSENKNTISLETITELEM